MTGRGQHFIVTLDLHMLDVGAQFAPQTIDHSQCGRVGLLKRREDHFVATEQFGIGGFHPALLGAGNRVRPDEFRPGDRV
jgi:hypothetical protein